MITETKRKLRMKPVPPFDFDLSAQIFSGGDPQVRTYDGECFWQVIRLGEKLTLITVRSTGTVAEPGMVVELTALEKITPSEAARAKKIVNRMFNLEIDLKPFYRAVKKDPVMGRVVKNLYGLKSPTTPTVFEALVDSIIEQQISLIAAHGMQNKLIKAFGDSMALEDGTYFAFPTPSRLAGARISGLRACGLSGKKSEYVRDTSRLVVSGDLDLEKFEGYDSVQKIRDELSQVCGIGAWTAEMTMIRGLHKMDSIPADDIGLQSKIAHFYGKGKRVTSSELQKVAENWGKYRGLGGYYLIVAHRLGIEP